MFFKHLFRLLQQFIGFAWHRKKWWILPLVLLMMLVALLITAGQAVAPFIYTLF